MGILEASVDFATQHHKQQPRLGEPGVLMTAEDGSIIESSISDVKSTLQSGQSGQSGSLRGSTRGTNFSGKLEHMLSSR